MPRVSNKDVLSERQDESQPYLLDDAGIPTCVAALDAIKTRTYEHQGKRLTEDDAKALRLVELLMMRWGVKKISREMSISPHTVRAAKRLLVVQGKLAPYKQRVTEAMEDAIEAGVILYRDALEDGKIQAAQIPVGVGILSDKRALALGEPTSISTAVSAVAEDLSVDALNAYLAELPSANPPSDSQSSGKPSEPQQNPPF